MEYPELICTIGPSSDSKDKLLALKKAGVDIFRVNMSHASIDDLKRFQMIAEEINIKIGVDTEGAQIRTKISKGKQITLKKNESFTIYCIPNKNEESTLLSLYPESVFPLIQVGQLLRFDFNGAVAKVISINQGNIQCHCLNNGVIGHNKGVDILNQSVFIPDFTEKDINALEISKSLGINEVFISFCKSVHAINTARKVNPNARVTSKIESKLSIHNLHNICKFSDSILIDRGDLTREISIMDIPFAQRGIVHVAQMNQTPCYVATNILESLINGTLPTRAELNDIVGTLEMGASGIVLAAETAIGNKPILCAEIVSELMHRYRLHKAGLLFADLDRDEITDDEMKIWLNRQQ